jgi:hypothetical protein
MADKKAFAIKPKKSPFQARFLPRSVGIAMRAAAETRCERVVGLLRGAQLHKEAEEAKKKVRSPRNEHTRRTPTRLRLTRSLLGAAAAAGRGGGASV